MLARLSPTSAATRLFSFAFLILYLELGLIRFCSAEVVYLGFFANFVLIAAFLGIGLGFLLGHSDARPFDLVPQLILLLIAFVVVTKLDATYLRDNAGQLFGHDATPLKVPLWLGLGLIFVTNAAIFAGLANEAARCFGAFRPIVAYSIDIVGSLAGIALFTLQSFLGAPPWTWFAVGFAMMVWLSDRRINTAVMGLGVVLILLGATPDHYVAWSPYQKIEVETLGYRGRKLGYRVSANSIPHQEMLPVGAKEPVYDFPYTRLGRKHYANVLIIGAGSGSDVAYAKHYGADHIDAVEIDPAILETGKRFHPSKPYDDDARVTRHVDDGRAYLRRTTKRYDLIIFALPDSLASLSGFSNIRLESFLFTAESLASARRCLAPGGTLVLYNFYRKRWLVDKLGGMLERAFGHPPRVQVYRNEARGMLAALAIGEELRGPPLRTKVQPATDDWPFLYMEHPTLPPMYILVMLAFIACAVTAVAATRQLKGLREGGAFALMGAAFLLLETKSIIQFLLLFGATWLVNALVFFAILSSILVANLVVHTCRLRPGVLFALLLGSLGVQYAIAPSQLLDIESTGLRYLAASAVHFSPVFFANLVFGYLFRDTEASATAFGWNIVGTTIGGALEYASLATGYRALTLVVLALYSACFVWTYWTLAGRRR